MPLQRVRNAENRIRNRLSNGPPRALSNVFLYRVFSDVLTYVSCRGCVGTLQAHSVTAVNQGGPADMCKFIIAVIRP